MKATLFLFGVLLVLPLKAVVPIEWASDLNETNRASDGATPLDGTYEFVLGTFVNLVPEAGNVSEWEAAFQPFGTAIYSVELGRFSNSKTLTSNTFPFVAGRRAYIWGRNGLGSGSEWILIGKPSWTWPVARTGGGPSFPVRWNVAEATEPGDVVLGTVEEGEFHMQTARVTFERSYQDWVILNFTEGEASGPEDDFDADGRSNFLEYALGSDPRVVNGPFQVRLTRDFRVEVFREPGRQVEWRLQSSTTLAGFSTMTSGYEVVVDEPGRLVYRITAAGGGRRFFRVQALPPS